MHAYPRNDNLVIQISTALRDQTVLKQSQNILNTINSPHNFI